MTFLRKLWRRLTVHRRRTVEYQPLHHAILVAQCCKPEEYDDLP